MRPTKEMLNEYKVIAKASKRNMKDCIRAHLVAHCPKFQGHEDRLDECIGYVTECAKEILGGKSGNVSDDACYKMARDFFNDELWDKADKPAKKVAQTGETEDDDDDVGVEQENPPTETPETKTETEKANGQVSMFDIAGFANA